MTLQSSGTASGDSFPADLSAGLEREETDPVLASWRRNVGKPVVVQCARSITSFPTHIDVLCWNLAIGRARLDEVAGRVREWSAGETPVGAEPTPLVMLVQEAYRSDDSVPPLAAGGFHGGARAAARPLDIVEFAHRHSLSLYYAPSMRNGRHRSDRGNAVLATVQLCDGYAFSLPLLRQRRVAVATELVGLKGLAFASTHLENRARLAHGPRSAIGFGSARSEQAEPLGRRILLTEGGDVVLGGDLNTPRGHRDPAFGSLIRAGFAPADPVGPWRHTFHGFLRLPLDHVLYHSHTGRIRRVEVRRLDENPRDRGALIFGSDHHPLLARVYLEPPTESLPPTGAK